MSVITLVIGFLAHFVGWLVVALYVPYITECGLIQGGPLISTALCQKECTILF